MTDTRRGVPQLRPKRSDEVTCFFRGSDRHSWSLPYSRHSHSFILVRSRRSHGANLHRTESIFQYTVGFIFCVRKGSFLLKSSLRFFSEFVFFFIFLWYSLLCPTVSDLRFTQISSSSIPSSTEDPGPYLLFHGLDPP